MVSKKYFWIIFVFFLSLSIVFGFTSLVKADTFNPNFIISDEEILDSTAMSKSDIQNFLENKNSYLAHYRCPDASGVIKSAAEIIYNAAVNNYDCDGVSGSANFTLIQKKQFCRKITINPRFLLVLLQKEQSLIENSSPSQNQLNWAVGYGCLDGQICNSRWRGFGKQINSASLQFYDYIINPQNYTYKKGHAYTVTNTGQPSTTIIPSNQATAALYNYTPHVYWGNYNFHKIWLRYFTFIYPNGTLLQVKGETGVWLIQDGKKRPFLTRGALTSRFDINKIIQVNRSILDKYITGAPIKFPQYSLIRSPHGTIFLLVDDKRRGFTSYEAFRKIGYNPEEVMDASWEDINAYKKGVPITATTSYPMGALLQDKTTGGIYYVFEGTKAPLWDAILLKTKFKHQTIFAVKPEKLAKYKTVKPAIFSDGELLKSSISPGVYVIDNHKRRPIISGKIFEDLGYKWENIITVPNKILKLYPLGDPMNKTYSEEKIDFNIKKNIIATSTKQTISTSTNTTKNLSSTTPEIKKEINNMLNP